MLDMLLSGIPAISAIASLFMKPKPLTTTTRQQQQTVMGPEYYNIMNQIAQNRAAYGNIKLPTEMTYADIYPMLQRAGSQGAAELAARGQMAGGPGRTGAVNIGSENKMVDVGTRMAEYNRDLLARLAGTQGQWLGQQGSTMASALGQAPRTVTTNTTETTPVRKPSAFDTMLKVGSGLRDVFGAMAPEKKEPWFDFAKSGWSAPYL